jgi:hypothetical protein
MILPDAIRCYGCGKQMTPHDLYTHVCEATDMPRGNTGELDAAHEQAVQTAMSALRSMLTHDLAQAEDDARTLLTLIEQERRIVEREG